MPGPVRKPHEKKSKKYAKFSRSTRRAQNDWRVDDRFHPRDGPNSWLVPNALPVGRIRARSNALGLAIAFEKTRCSLRNGVRDSRRDDAHASRELCSTEPGAANRHHC